MFLPDEGAWDSYAFPARAVHPAPGPEGATARPDSQLADYQQEALAAITAGLRGHGAPRGLVCLPAGVGLVRVALEWALREVVGRKRRVLWVAPRVDRLDQVHQDLLGLRWLLPRRKPLTVTRCDGRGRDLGGDVALCSLAGLTAPEPGAREIARAGPKLGAVVYDEADPARAGAVLALCARLGVGTVPLLALAPFPPESPPAVALAAALGPPLFARTFRSLRAAGHLARPIFVPVAVPRVALPAPPPLPAPLPDLPEAALAALGRDRGRTAALVEHWLGRAGRYGKSLVAACDLAHAEALAAAFQERGVAAAALHGQLAAEERRDRLARFRRGRIQVLACAGRLPSGEVVADTATVVLARPTLDPACFLALLAPAARGPRAAPGKDRFHVLECAEDLGGLGLPAGAAVVPWIEDDDARDLPVAGPPSPGDPERRGVALAAALAWLESRGLAPAARSFVGEVVWQTPAGRARSVVVPAGTLGALEEALGHVRTGLALGSWRAAEEHGALLASLGAMRAPDWNDLVAEAKQSGRAPALVRVPGLAPTAEDYAAGRLVFALAQAALAEGAADLRRRCAAALRDGLPAARRFPDAQTLAREVLALVTHLYAQQRAPAPARGAPPWDDVEAFVSLGLAVGRADGELDEAERNVVRVGAARVFQLEDADLGRLGALLARGETAALDLERAARRLRQWPFGTVLGLFDWLLHVAIADTRFSEEERQILSGIAGLLGITQEEYRRRCAWYLDVDPSVPVEVAPGVRACAVCGAAFPAAARFCGDCGASLGGDAPAAGTPP